MLIYYLTSSRLLSLHPDYMLKCDSHGTHHEKPLQGGNPTLLIMQAIQPTTHPPPPFQAYIYVS